MRYGDHTDAETVTPGMLTVTETAAAGLPVAGGVVAVVVGAVVVGATVVGATVVGATVVGATVVGATVVGATVVGATVVGATVVGLVVGLVVVGFVVGVLPVFTVPDVPDEPDEPDVPDDGLTTGPVLRALAGSSRALMIGGSPLAALPVFFDDGSPMAFGLELPLAWAACDSIGSDVGAGQAFALQAMKPFVATVDSEAPLP